MTMSTKTLSGDVGKTVKVTVGSPLNATDCALTGEFMENVTVDRPDVNTTVDMEKLEKWKYGDTVQGTFAKSLQAYRNYREDIEEAYGKEDDYKPIYVDTMNQRKNIGDQLKKLK